jgi:hypothetical protein
MFPRLALCCVRQPPKWQSSSMSGTHRAYLPVSEAISTSLFLNSRTGSPARDRGPIPSVFLARLPNVRL